MFKNFNKILLVVFSILVLLFILIPIIILVISSFNASQFFVFPPTGFTLDWYLKFFRSQGYQSSLWISTQVALSAVLVSLLTGVPAAFALDRYDYSINTFLQGIFLSPLLLPQIIWSVGLLQFFNVIRIRDFTLTGTFYGLVIAHAVVILPYMIRMVLTGLSYVERDLESAAMSLGARPLVTFLRVTIPITLPSIIVGSVFGFMISFTNVVVSSFIAGARYITFPVRMYSEIRTEGLDPLAVAISSVVVTIIVILAMIGERTIKWSQYM